MLDLVEKLLALLSESVLRDQPAIRRKKIESLITSFVHKRDICRELIAKHVANPLDLEWLKVSKIN